MLSPYQQSAVLVYRSTTATSLKGSLITFFEFCPLPVMFAILSANILSIFMINPFFDVQSFLADIPELCGDLDSPLYLFPYDQTCLESYDSLFNFHLVDFLSNYQIKAIGTDHFTTLEDFYSYTLPECYASFFTNDMYLRFGQTGDLTDILNFVRSIMFSKLVLLIDTCSTQSFSTIAKDIAPVLHGSSVVSLPAGACLIDIETVGLDEYSDFIMFSLYANNSFTGYYLNKPDETGQKEFRQFIDYLLQGFDLIYVLNGSFESLFFPSYTNFVDIKFNKYQYWASSRKLVHLPFYHLQFDPGSGKNVPIWNKLYLLEHDDQWKDLMLHRTVTNILTKIAILSSNELKIPFQDPIVADPRRLRPTPDFLEQFGECKQTLLNKKVQFHPIVYHDTYGYQEGKYAEMYLDNMLFFEEEAEESSNEY